MRLQSASMTIRPYNADTDFEATLRCWRECGWLEADQIDPLPLCLENARVLIGEVNGEAETNVLNVSGTIRHGNEDLPLSVVTTVTTSRVARRQGLAGRVTAQAIARDAVDGAQVSALGIFEQGFYNKLGFGTLSYDYIFEFDPATLRLPDGVKARPPRRLTKDDYEAMHANRLTRRRGHGSCSLTPAAFSGAAGQWLKGGFGLGYFDGPDGALSHHFWCATNGKEEHGPYRIVWMAYRNDAQLLELLALLHGLGDQVRTIRMSQPPGIMLQDMLLRPMHRRAITRGSDFKQDYWIAAWQQARICDVPGCLGRTKLPGSDSMRFNLKLSDPIETWLPDDAPWRGVAGEYVVELGPSCEAESGRDDSLPTLTTSVNALTRLWLGVVPASGLTITEHFDAPRELIERLDLVIRLPRPCVDWDF